MFARLLLGLVLEHVCGVALQLVERGLVVCGRLRAGVAACRWVALLGPGLALWVWGLTALVWCGHDGSVLSEDC